MTRLSYALMFGALCAVLPHQAAANPPQSIIANQNRTPAGVLRNGVLSVALEARTGMWHPQADDGGGLEVQAFGEPGKPLQIPGPLIRVRAGTKVSFKLHNTLTKTLIIGGLHTRPGNARDSVHIAAGATRTIEFLAGQPGTYYYWGTTTESPVDLRDGVDSQLNGAFIVDPAEGPIPTDRIFVLGLWFSPASRDSANPRPDRVVMVINGKSWPNTERLTYQTGDVVRWHVINPTSSSHPMHLHGFYFKLLNRGNWAVNSVVPTSKQRELATELMLQGDAMLMEWTPVREGNWVFHCHFAFHVSDELYLAPKASDQAHAHGGKAVPHSMAGLVMGIEVTPKPGMVAAKSSESPRQLRLIAAHQADTSFAMPKVGYALSDGADPPPIAIRSPGPILRLKRGQPVAIKVVNRLREPTAVHWHGIELESFPDGVPGWSGTRARIMPPIAPQDSFVAEFVPPRAGTFIYHSHSNELGQILGGLVGPLIVEEPGASSENDRVFLVSAAASKPEELQFGRVNGMRELVPMRLVANQAYRFRFINIGDWRMMFTLLEESSFPNVKMIAKDGADLREPVTGPLNLLTGPGETADYEIKLPAGKYRLEFKQMLAGWIIPVDLYVR
jgi:FtsP/CotA-like multicopper oxidase with cupredoxin domain